MPHNRRLHMIAARFHTHFAAPATHFVLQLATWGAWGTVSTCLIFWLWALPAVRGCLELSALLDIVMVGVAGMALEWKREDVLLLLSCYKEHPVLWNVKLTEYRDRNAKEIAYLKIHEVMQNDIQNITTEQIKKKIHTLRSQYKREIKFIRESKKSGMAAEDVYNANCIQCQLALWFACFCQCRCHDESCARVLLVWTHFAY